MSDKELLAQIGMIEEEAEARAQDYERDSWDAAKLGKPRRGLCGRSGKGTWPYSVGGAATHRGGGEEPRIGITVCSVNGIRHR